MSALVIGSVMYIIENPKLTAVNVIHHNEVCQLMTSLSLSLSLSLSSVSNCFSHFMYPFFSLPL